MVKRKTTRKKRDPFEFPFWAEHLLTKEAAIKKERFIFSDGGSVEIGIFLNTVLDCTSGAFLLRDKESKVVS